MSKPALLVLAAGMGSRYGGLKQIDPVGPNGEIILDYSIFDALRAGFGKIVFVIRRDIEKEFRSAVGSHWEKSADIEYAFQDLAALPAPFQVPEGRSKPWGTGHAVLCAQDHLRGLSFAAINADDFYGRSGYDQLTASLAAEVDSNCHFMVGFPLRNTLSEFGSVSRGICRTDASGILQEVIERTKIEPDGNGKAAFTADDGSRIEFSGSEIASMNFWGFRPSLFDRLGSLFEEFLAQQGTQLKSEFYLPFAVASMIQAGQARVKVLESRDSWFGVTYREDKPRVQQDIRNLIASGVYPEHLF